MIMPRFSVDCGRFLPVLVCSSSFFSTVVGFHWFWSVFRHFQGKLRIWDAETGSKPLQEAIWRVKRLFWPKNTSDDDFEHFWSILATTPDHRRIHDFSQIWPNAPKHAFPSRKSLVFQRFESFCLSHPTSMVSDTSEFDDFGSSAALFTQNIEKTRFTPSNHLLEWFRARLRLSNADWDPETGRTARFIDVWSWKWWFLVHFSLKNEGNAPKPPKIKRNREKPTEPDQNRKESTQTHLQNVKKIRTLKRLKV